MVTNDITALEILSALNRKLPKGILLPSVHREPANCCSKATTSIMPWAQGSLSPVVQHLAGLGNSIA
ncbi:hypothetical protein I7I53_04254 [Histoplasma capsulatum var. duboisii H88]|uniref:Uncharacterized protein n=1 Tax=Ajellomyces capsulatus (strain H88) TaxID=544711 RepID=A0A8A1LQ34_AJEC8|nr:hypothetical protein I7I53_04254 [Histoplasma capsulatum var. duboisii H88]